MQQTTCLSRVIRLSPSGVSLILFVMLLLITACNADLGSTVSSVQTDKGVNSALAAYSTFFDGFDSTVIDSNKWQVATWAEHGGQTGKERCYTKNGLLYLVFVNDSQAGFLSAAIQTRQEFLYGRWDVKMKVSSLPRICNAMYTIDWDDRTNPGADNDGTKQEIDIEFLTRTFTAGAGTVHFAVHHQNIPADSFQTNPDIALGFNPAGKFHIWSLEITPREIRWYVDYRLLQTYTYSGNPITIDAPYQLKFNTWSGVNWVTGSAGNPPLDTPGEFVIDWVKFTPYVP